MQHIHSEDAELIYIYIAYTMALGVYDKQGASA